MDGSKAPGKDVTAATPTVTEMSSKQTIETPSDDAVSKAFDTAGWFSRATWSWCNKVVSVGYKRQLCEDDIPPLKSYFTVEHELATFERIWEEELKTEAPSLGRAFKKQFKA
jgi:hypothetical protein